MQIQEVKSNSNDYNFSHAEHLDFKTVKEMFNQPKKLAMYMFKHPELLDAVQPGAFEYATIVGKEKGFEAYYKEWLEDASKGFSTIFKLTNLENPEEEITLYRGVVIFDVEPDVKEPGICWSYEKDGAEDWLEAISSTDDPNDAPCILTGITKIENVDWIMTFLLLCSCPEEKEIRIWDDLKIKVVDWEVL